MIFIKKKVDNKSCIFYDCEEERQKKIMSWTLMIY